MKTTLLAAVFAVLSGCLVPVDPKLGSIPCADRCDDGCCYGDPASVDTVCIGRESQGDDACGFRAQTCFTCGIYTTREGNVIVTTCATLADYNENDCVLVK